MSLTAVLLLQGLWLAIAGDCACSKSGLKCYYDPTCPGLGCGAEDQPTCRFCGSGDFKPCPKHPEQLAKAEKHEQDSKDVAPKPAAPSMPKLAKPPASSGPGATAKLPASVSQPKAAKAAAPASSPDAAQEASHEDKAKCPCENSKTQRCYYDASCPGLGCGAMGHDHCRFCGDDAGNFKACPSAHEMKLAAMEPKKSEHAAPAAAQAAQAPAAPQELKVSKTLLDSAMSLDCYRSMAAAAVDTHPMEDDDIADLAGAIKYVHTEILTEHLQSPIRTRRKYHVDAITAHRVRFKNPDTLWHAPDALQGEFGAFVTYDWGKATNPAQLPMIAAKGNFVGIAPCTNLHCDVRYPRHMPYAWLSLGNWCPNLTWDKKGSKLKPNPECLKSKRGDIVRGGLCAGGFNKNSEMPGSDPTGEQDCVYTYGKAKLVKWDDIVGITQENCGKHRCKDWLDFRMNCTNSRYKRQFGLDGSIKKVDYCVEFDIHPACEASCEVDRCKQFLASGSESYLGLPFWSGRCDPRANERRVEMVAFSLGIPGSLKSHGLVDPEVLERPCPLSKGTSWTCQPLNGHGPYCTRSYNGACDHCFIPGTKDGPSPSLKPWCPLDIFRTPTYSEMPKPVCASEKASEGCCLYTGHCKGDPDASAAELTDDGMALVASKMSTLDMEQFLRRAASKDDRFLGLSLDLAGDNMKWAAYFAWGAAPADRTLDEALEELKVFLAAKTPMVTPFVTTTTTTQLIKVIGPPAARSAMKCAEREVSFVPLDMPAAPMSLTTLAGCQERCAKQQGCFHFSFLEAVGLEQGSCHLASFSALPQAPSPSWISGPPKCWKDIEDKSLLIDKGHETYVPVDFACMTWGSSFSPMDGKYMPLLVKDYPKEEDAVLECQKRCRRKENCEHFTVAFPLRTCALAGPGALAMDGIAGAISGPPKCAEKSMQSYYWELLPGYAQSLWSWTKPVGLKMVMGGILLAAAVGLLVFRRRLPERSVRGVQRMLLPEEDLEFEMAALE